MPVVPEGDGYPSSRAFRRPLLLWVLNYGIWFVLTAVIRTGIERFRSSKKNASKIFQGFQNFKSDLLCFTEGSFASGHVFSEKNNLESQTMSSGVLGQIVSWSVPQQVSYSVLRQALDNASLPSDRFAKELAPKDAIKRAFNKLKERRIIRQLRVEGSLIYFQVTGEKITEQEAIYQKELELYLDLENKRVDAHGIGSQAQLSFIRDVQQQMERCIEEKTANDLTRLVQKIFDEYKSVLVPIREQGGAYFVPDVHKNLVDRIRVLLQGIGGNLRSFSVQLGGKYTEESVAESMCDYLTKCITEYKESCDSITEKSRSDVKNNRLKDATVLRRKLETYRGLLRTFADKVESELKEAEESFLTKLSKIGV